MKVYRVLNMCLIVTGEHVLTHAFLLHNPVKIYLHIHNILFASTVKPLNHCLTVVKRCKEDKKNLETMRNDAIIARDAAKEELAKMEKQVYEDRRKREIELTEIRKEAEEKKAQNERIERRIATQVRQSLLIISVHVKMYFK